MRSARPSTGAGPILELTLATTLALTLALTASPALALGFGRNSNSSTLGQPLNFTVPLRFEAGEFVDVECVGVDVLAGEQKVPPASVRVTLDPAADGNSDRVLHVATRALMDEPIASIEVNIGCPVRLTRKFVVFIDPPVVNLAQAAPVVPPAVVASPDSDARSSTADALMQPAPAPRLPAPAAASPASAPRPARAARPVIQPPGERKVSTPALPAAESTPRSAVPTARAPAGPRLQLDPAERLAKAAPRRAASAPLAVAAAASPAAVAAPAAPAASPAVAAAAVVPAAEAASAVAAQSAAALAAAMPASEAAAASPPSPDRERLQALEAQLAKLSADADATRNSIGTLQSRLREAEAGRYANPLVYALAAVAALFAAALIALMLWVRRRELRRAEWWRGIEEEAALRAGVTRPAGEAGPESVSHAAPAVETTSTAPAMALAAPPEGGPTTAPAVQASALGSTVTGPITWRPTAAIPELSTGDVPRRAFSAEELVDLEQQADFFVTLGQDDAAIELLTRHVQASAGSSPLPYLKLLEIQHRQGDRPAHEEVRRLYRQRFGLAAPSWDDAVAPASSLEARAGALSQIQQAWPAPPRAMGVLERLLLERGDTDFDLATYRDLLFLYEIARDLAENGNADGRVDLELPLAFDLGPQ